MRPPTVSPIPSSKTSGILTLSIMLIYELFSTGGVYGVGRMKECGGEVSTQAKACPKCGAKIPHTKWWPWGPLIVVVLIVIWGAITGPKNTAELAQMETEICMRSQGGGDWRASSGITLDTYCKTKGAIIGIKKVCEIDPSKC